uniref:Uncharacterized protein n=1 Tax=Myotis myotis TaxID=51298 RepID=A0A7J7ZYL0_MYOMY|nr:hypothetical protein mMyoMyo1_009968 [Myotis myotis]
MKKKYLDGAELIYILEAQCTNSCTSVVPHPCLWDQPKPALRHPLRGPRLREGAGQDKGPHWCTIRAREGQGRLVSQEWTMGGLQGMSSPSCSVLISQTPAASYPTSWSVCPLVVSARHRDWSTG